MAKNVSENMVEEVVAVEIANKAPKKRNTRGKAKITVPKYEYIIVFNYAKNKFEATVSGCDEFKDTVAYGTSAILALQALGKKIIKPVINI